jgi:hypothetical protein
VVHLELLEKLGLVARQEEMELWDYLALMEFLVRPVLLGQVYPEHLVPPEHPVVMVLWDYPVYKARVELLEQTGHPVLPDQADHLGPAGPAVETVLWDYQGQKEQRVRVVVQVRQDQPEVLVPVEAPVLQEETVLWGCRDQRASLVQMVLPVGMVPLVPLVSRVHLGQAVHQE